MDPRYRGFLIFWVFPRIYFSNLLNVPNLLLLYFADFLVDVPELSLELRDFVLRVLFALAAGLLAFDVGVFCCCAAALLRPCKLRLSSSVRSMMSALLRSDAPVSGSATFSS